MLTPLEFKLLAVFVRHPNQVLSHEQLLELVWGDALSGSRARAKLYVGYLRQKLRRGGGGGDPDRDRARLRVPLPAQGRLNAPLAHEAISSCAGSAGCTARIGIVTRNVAPSPSLLASVIRPPWACTIALEMARPSPVPE